MSERKVAGFCEDNCKFEVYTKEEIISLFEYVIANNALPEGIINGGSVTSALAAVNAIVEQNKGAALKFFVGTQTEWDAYTGDKTNMHPFLSDDATIRNLTNRVTTLEQNVESLDKTVNDICAGTVGDIIIPHKRLLWNNTIKVEEDEKTIFESTTDLTGKTLEIIWTQISFFPEKVFKSQFHILYTPQSLPIVVEVGYNTNYQQVYTGNVIFYHREGNKITGKAYMQGFMLPDNTIIEMSYNIKVLAIYEVIE